MVLCFSSSHSPAPKIFRPVLSTTRWIASCLSALSLVCNIRPLPRRDRVETSGTEISTRSKAAMERTSPWVWRNGCLKTMPNVRQSSIARSEYRGCPPRVVRRGAVHKPSASSLIQNVRSPRRRKPSLYSDQFITRCFCLGIFARQLPANQQSPEIFVNLDIIVYRGHTRLQCVLLELLVILVSNLIVVCQKRKK